jgi:hypothetical protein
MAADSKSKHLSVRDGELRERVESVKQREGYEHLSEATSEVIERGLDDWETEKASYPGSDLVERGIEISAVGFVVGLVATIITSGGVSFRPAMGLSLTVLMFLGFHYAAIEMQRRGEV